MRKLMLTFIFPADRPMSEQGQPPKSTAAQEGCLGFQERANKNAQWDIVCLDSSRDDTERYKTAHRLKPQSSLLALCVT